MYWGCYCKTGGCGQFHLVHYIGLTSETTFVQPEGWWDFACPRCGTSHRLMDMVGGLVGALVGGFLSSHLGMGGVGEHGLMMSIVIAVVGAIILTLVLRLITGKRSANI